MKKNMSKVRVFRAFAGIAAGAVIVCLLVEGRFDFFEPRSVAYAFAVALSLMGAFVPASLVRGPQMRALPTSGESLSLESFGLTPKERIYVLEFLGGKQIKEIASDHGVAASTVRNALSLAYKKLGISSKAELLALGAYYRIE